jgi:hypothetical protein
MNSKNFVFPIFNLGSCLKKRKEQYQKHCLLSKQRLLFSLLLCLVFAGLALAINPESAGAVEIGECKIHSSSKLFQTSTNPNANRLSVNNIEDPEIQETSHVTVSVSEFSSEGAPFFGEAIFWVDDIAPYNGGFRLRTEVNTQITNVALPYKVFYTSFTGNCQ